tara:strand:+ start:2901 stop:3218 length:318 start_codon:yes stop_codon:yes gene_type:complete
MFNIQTATNSLGFLCNAQSLGDQKKVYYFKNGFGCSVVGSPDNYYEIGLLKGQRLCYIDNSKFWNVISGLEHKQVLEILKEVSEMPNSNTVKTSEGIGDIDFEWF